MMKKAVVLGATGSIGYAITKELAEKGVNTIAFSRTRSKLMTLFGDHSAITVCAGNVFHINDLREACRQADLIVHAINIPYQDWERDLHTIMDNVLKVTEEAHARLAVVDNIYAYSDNPGYPIAETHKKQPHTKKGRLRLSLEKRIWESNVKALIAHFPDFYGPYAGNTLLGQTFKGVSQNKPALFVGKLSTPREYIYTPDAAKALITLAAHEKAYGQNWNIPGSGVITGEQIFTILRERLSYKKSVWSIGKKAIAFMGWFQPLMKEAVEMLYLTENPIILSGEKYESVIDEIPRTPYEQGIVDTVRAMR
ncbi:membrane protein [Pullulanibacillus camelliae]|uniref:Membrane protein n=1 Tax=Pullulanibacillus camelliae TaxID=1707096 RepID=A0A8J2VFP8_9BACL|nr:NAD-dependent epimerase/dehydratase family protein [Pullulanibacillus camelliae]GGE26781.1 membrane protein [Pullulanibacillus camelliae]